MMWQTLTLTSFYENYQAKANESALAIFQHRNGDLLSHQVHRGGTCLAPSHSNGSDHQQRADFPI